MNIKDFFKKEKWALVSTLTVTVNWTDTGDSDDIVYYLYESSKGNRDLEYKVEHDIANTRVKHTKMYLKKIYPWLKGVNFPYIPNYSEIINEKKEEYVKRLYKLILME